MASLWELFLTFAKIGMFTFGGGYAMISVIENTCVERKKWITHEELMDMTVIAESTPGPIAINSATYIGYKQAGILGSVVATLGMTLPSFCIIYAISLFFDAFLSVTVVACAFRGIQIAVLYLILSAGLRMLKKMKKTPFSRAVLLLTLIGMVTLTLLSVKLSTVVYILASGAAGVTLWLIQRLRRGKKGREA